MVSVRAHQRSRPADIFVALAVGHYGWDTPRGGFRHASLVKETRTVALRESIRPLVGGVPESMQWARGVRFYVSARRRAVVADTW